MNALVVDDDVETAEYLLRMLGGADFHSVSVANSAGEALNLLKGWNKNRSINFDVILLDIHLPDLDGVRLCERIKKISDFADIPILMATADHHPFKIRASFEAGAVDFVKKPFDKVEFLSRIRSALRVKAEFDTRKSRERELVDLAESLRTVNLQLDRLSGVDFVTGISNRRRFEEALDSEWRRHKRDHQPMSLIMIDLDHFKDFNDSYGHQAGDQALRAVAQSLAGLLKRPGDIVARYGGEEFVALLPNTDVQGACLVAKQFSISVRNLAIPHRGSPMGNLTISQGVSTSELDLKMEPSDLIRLADQALYQAKKEGRNRLKIAEYYLPAVKLQALG
jgi:diguanylate cyclase (GGDEF)-like protein